MRAADGPLRARLRRALDRRAPLGGDGRTTAFRLVNGPGDDLDGATVDRFGDVLVLSFYRPLDPRPWVEALALLCTPRSIYLKHRPRAASRLDPETLRLRAPEAPAWGPAVDQVDVLEAGLRFRIRPGEGLAVGLYLDMRESRRWVRAHARATKLLNCFAYTGGFAVAARAGGAAAAVNVDLSRRALAWAEENAALNGQPPGESLAGDVFRWLARLGRAGRSFSTVVLDPPAFARGPSGAFSVSRDTPRLVARAAALLEPSGRLVACCNQESLPAARFLRLVERGLTQAGRRATVESRLQASPLDFPPAPGAPPAFRGAVLRLDGLG
ncbi:MAG TPA: class I SAM-dependent methyltransferase [Myxococcaceae bacterium]|nr:class I SAM-dependent methyltransferase [Myxococcaceae bacterium]